MLQYGIFYSKKVFDLNLDPLYFAIGTFLIIKFFGGSQVKIVSIFSELNTFVMV